jgi:hypothetical protein
MAWEIWGQRWDDAESTTTDLYVSFKPSKNVTLLAIRTWIIVFDNPTYTAGSMKIYSNTGSASASPSTPNKLLYTSSNTVTSSDLQPTEANAVSEVYFEFNPTAGNLGDSMGEALRKDEWYHAVINWTGYSGNDDTSHLAWRNGWPDHPYKNKGFTLSANSQLVDPFSIAIVSADL